MCEISELVDKQLELKKQINVEIEKFKDAVDSHVFAFEKDTGVCLKKVLSGIFISTIKVEIDFKKTRERMKKVEDDNVEK